VVKKVPVNAKLREALELYQEKWLSKLPTDEAMEPYDFSSAFKKKMQKLIRVQRKPYYTFVNTVGKRIAVIAIIVIMAMSGTVLSVKALRNPIVNFFIEVYEKFSRVVFQIDNPDESTLTEIEEYFTPQYIPEGYVLKTREELNMAYLCEYVNDDGSDLIYNQMLFNESKMMIDTEGTVTEDIMINGIIGIFFNNKGYDNIIWNDGVYIYYISGFSELGKDELLKFAESIK